MIERLITSNGTVYKREASAPLRYIGWRGLYRIEGGNDHAWNMPAVIPSQYNGQKSAYAPPIRFTQALQSLSWEFTKFTNKLMTSVDWAYSFRGDVMLTNGNGWDSKVEPDDQRHDYVNNRYTSYEDPSLMDGLYCAGNFMPHMDEYDGHLWAVPGKSGVDVTKPLPTVKQIWDNNWYMRLTVNQRLSNSNPFDFPNGYGGGVFVPYFLKRAVPFTKTHFEKWDSDRLPDPLKIGG